VGVSRGERQEYRSKVDEEGLCERRRRRRSMKDGGGIDPPVSSHLLEEVWLVCIGRIASYDGVALETVSLASF
jgi:hypothetical protein